MQSLLSSLLLTTCFTAHADAGATVQADVPTRTVVWLSIDGIDPGYIERGETPTLDRLTREGAYSTEFIPVFPSLTFPSHVSQATGAKVAKHGVPGNSFITNTDWREHRYPWNSQLLQAEPIWNTATRQGVRVLVHDWPLSHSQRGEHAAAHHGERYVTHFTDEQRLTLLLDTWAKDQEAGVEQPLRLIMGYAVGPDSLGHSAGPNAPEPVEKLEEVDGLLLRFLNRMFTLWDRQRGEDDELYFILTTDHGMSEVHSLVNISYLADIGSDPNLPTMTSGNVGHIFVKDGGESREEIIAELMQRIATHEFATAYRREDLPQQWEYDHPERVGDIVVVLDKGYTFSARPRAVTGPSAELGGPLGMHGYDPRTNPEMLGVMIIWRFPEPFGGRNLGQVHALQMHATVADLLGIEPSDDARTDGITIPASPVREPVAQP